MISKITLPFNVFIPKDLTYVFLSVFFILLDLSPFSRGQEYIFPEVIKILQKINKLKEVEKL